MTTPADVFAEIDDRLRSDPSHAQAIGEASYLFDLGGEDGGPFHVTVSEGRGEAGPGAVDAPDVTFSLAASDLVDLREGRLDGTTAFMSGKIKIRGDMGRAMKLQTLMR